MFSEKKWLATVAQNVFKSSKKVAMSATLTPSTSTFKANECRDREEIKQKLSARIVPLIPTVPLSIELKTNSVIRTQQVNITFHF